MNAKEAWKLASLDRGMLLDITGIEKRIKASASQGDFSIIVTLECAEYAHSARVKKHFQKLGYAVNEQEYPSILHISWNKPK